MKLNTNLNKTSFGLVLKTFQNIMSETINFLTDNSTTTETLRTNANKVGSMINSQSSVHKYFKHVFEENTIIHGIEVILGEREEVCSENNIEVVKMLKDKAQYIPMLKLLTLILQNDCLRNLILTENTNGNSWNYKSYTDGQEYKNHPLFQDHPNAIRLVLYSDDIEVVNPIGAKTGIHKLTIFYFRIQNFPAYFNTKVTNIFLLTIAYSYDVQRYGYEKILSPFITDLNALEEGVNIQIKEKDFLLFGTLIVYTGDTLAASEIMELLGSSSFRFCRSCMITRTDLKEKNLFNFNTRTKEMHNNFLGSLRRGENVPKDFGIKNVDSVLNKSKFFHISNNRVFDIMHDLLEGVVPMEIKLVLHYYIIEKKYFSVDSLNKSINMFKYGPTEKKNRPSSNFTNFMLQKKGNALKQRAIQSWLLLRVLPFLIQSKIPNDDKKHMVLLNLLLKIIEISFSFNISEQMVFDLEELIKLHYRQFMHLFPNINFINKHHHITHYPEIIRQKGPLVLYSCLNFESKHKMIKEFISQGCNFINLPKSIVTEFTVEQSIHISSNCYKNPDIEIISSKECLLENVASHPLLVLENPNAEKIEKVFVININTMRYTRNVIITLESTYSMYPNFYRIKDIIKMENAIFFYMQLLNTITFDSDLNAYKIEETTDMILFNINNIENFKPTSIWRHDTSNYIAMKEYHF